MGGVEDGTRWGSCTWALFRWDKIERMFPSARRRRKVYSSVCRPKEEPICSPAVRMDECLLESMFQSAREQIAAGVDQREAMREVSEATGVEWEHPGVQGECPPRSYLPDISGFLERVPRRVRRWFLTGGHSRSHGVSCLLERMHDAWLISEITGVDRLAEYLDAWEARVPEEWDGQVPEILDFIKVVRAALLEGADVHRAGAAAMVSAWCGWAKVSALHIPSFRMVDCRPPPGRLADASARLTNAPPLQFVAPRSVGELMAA